MRIINIFVLMIIVIFQILAQECTIELDISDSTCCVVTDNLGRRVGVDSRYINNPTEWKRYREIPKSYYAFDNLEDLGDTTTSTYWFEVGLKYLATETDEVYKIDVIGNRYNIFSLSSEIGLSSQWNSYRIRKIPIDMDNMVTYKLHVRTSSGKLVSQIIKEVGYASLIQDISVMKKLNWISTQEIADKYAGFYNAYNTQIQEHDLDSAKITLNNIVNNLVADSASTISADAYKSLRTDTDQLLNQLNPSGCNVKLVNSTGIKITGGTLQYYDGSWKDAVNNNNGTFFVNTTKTTLSLRMTYEYASQTKSNVPISSDTIVFQTVNAQIQLQNSSGTLIDTGSVQYYAGAWRNLGATTNGIAAKELLPNNYSFRMTYAYASKDKQQDIGANPIVVFQTVNAAVQLQNSQGSLMPAPSGDQGTVQYYSGAWREFGTTSNGMANKELLANNYSFRMTYAYASKDKQQDIGTDPAVIFQTVNAAVQLQNSQGALIDQGTVHYYSGAWRDFGTTSNGTANKELLPNNYSFRMTYAYASKDKQQDLSSNPTVVFQTVNAAVQLKNSQGNLIDQGTVQYYSGAWRSFGTTTNGISNKELLPNNYSFRMTYEYASIDKQQDLSVNSTVDFSTVLCTIRVKNAQSQPINGATASYYSGAWRQIGNTVNGEITKELLPLNLSFRAKYGTQQQDKQQNISTNNIVEFVLP